MLGFLILRGGAVCGLAKPVSERGNLIFRL